MDRSNSLNPTQIHTSVESYNDLYSRQIYTYGLDAMNRMKNAKILISGINGLGLEAAKNIALGGVDCITLHDQKSVTCADQSSMYYADDQSIGKNRAGTCFTKLSELNPYVRMDTSDQDLTEDFIKDYSIVVMCDTQLNELVKVNDICRKHGIGFIFANTFGLIGQIFCDFGPEHLIIDPDGEKIIHGLVDTISSEQNARITCTEPHNLTNDDVIRFNDLTDMVHLNNREFSVLYIDRTTFSITNDTSRSPGFNGSGDFYQVKQSKTMCYKSLSESMECPEFVITDFANFDRPGELHALYLAYSEIQMSGLSATLDNMLPVVARYNDQVPEDLIKKFVHVHTGNLCPMQAVIGGTVAQEVMKASSNRYTPINQWLYFDRLDCLASNYQDSDIRDTGSRYDGQTRIFGQAMQQKIADQKLFVVGAGAIGSEHLKNFAMMGLATSDRGQMIVTDMDIIEKSNLNRQFLFRNQDIGNSKSISAARSIKEMNPSVNCIAHENRVGSDNESIYGRQFYENLDFVANALDNIDARLYMDGQCVLHGLPLLESGTLGTKGNVQVIIPHLTESYGSSRDPPETSIPVCTLKNFPNDITHTIEWAKDVFAGLFEQAPLNAANYLTAPESLQRLQPGDLIQVAGNIESVLKNVPTGINDCIEYGYRLWHDQFRDQIAQLLHKFPSDHKTAEGSAFWSGSKRCPLVLKFDTSNDAHINYIYSFSKLWANVFGLVDGFDYAYVKTTVGALSVPRMTIDRDAQISATEEEEKEKQKRNAEASMLITGSDIIKNLPDPELFRHIRINPQKFEKDDDTNHHIDFITATSNMRASNYCIPHADNLKTKGIAGKIIPAIATTTSIVSGLACLELYKIIQGFDRLEDYNNGFINLALSYYGFSDPMPCPVTSIRGTRYSAWDHFEIKQDMTLQEFIDYFETTYGYELDMVSYGEMMLYSFFIPGDELNRRLGTSVRTIIEGVLGKTIDSDMILLTIDVDNDGSGDSDTEVDLPQVKYYLL
jgi:ubiquitin-activating enzyme E1